MKDKARYLKQPDNYGCLPTAYMNAYKYAGFDISMKQHKDKFYKKVLSKPRIGTIGRTSFNKRNHWPFLRCMDSKREIDVEWLIANMPNYNTIGGVKYRNIAIVSYCWYHNDKNGSHSILVFDYDPETGMFSVANDRKKGPACTEMPYDEMDKKLRFKTYEANEERWMHSHAYIYSIDPEHLKYKGHELDIEKPWSTV